MVSKAEFCCRFGSSTKCQVDGSLLLQVLQPTCMHATVPRQGRPIGASLGDMLLRTKKELFKYTELPTSNLHKTEKLLFK